MENDSVEVTLRDDGIVHVRFMNNAVVDIKLQEKLHVMYESLCGKKKHPFLFSAVKNVAVTKEARKNAQKLEAVSPISKTAILAQNTLQRMIAQFYYRFNRPQLPFRIFKKEEEAVKWLLSSG